MQKTCTEDLGIKKRIFANVYLKIRRQYNMIRIKPVIYRHLKQGCVL